MRIEDLKDGQTVRARWGRAGKYGPRYGSWRDVVLHVQRAPATKREPERVYLISLRNVNWAEYAPCDYIPDQNLFLAEDYYLQIDILR